MSDNGDPRLKARGNIKKGETSTQKLKKKGGKNIKSSVKK
jgi:hypothetical protein